jgi:hypothetical protein
VIAPGIFEMTRSFSGPDGRATWEWTKVTDADGRTQPAVRWRRLGSHRIFGELTQVGGSLPPPAHGVIVALASPSGSPGADCQVTGE